MPTPSYEDALDAVAKWRDQHSRQSVQWATSVEYYNSTDNKAQLSHASGMLERNNFAVQSLSDLLRKLEKGV